MGCPGLFSQVNPEKNSNIVCIETCLWTSAEGRNPNKRSKGREGYLGRWLSNRRRALKGLGNGSFYESDQKIAESYGYPDLFERVRK
jgi:hypothetical protein